MPTPSALPTPDASRIKTATYAHSGHLWESEYSGEKGFSETLITDIVALVLKRRGYSLRSRAKSHTGPDVEAVSPKNWRIVVEAKGEAGIPDAFYARFVAALGQILLRMNREDTTYVVAVPWHKRYVDLLRKVPRSLCRRLNLEFWLVAPATGKHDYHVGILPSDVD